MLDVGVLDPAPHLGDRLAGAHQRDAPQVDVADTRCSASRFSARSAPTKSSTNGLAGCISSSVGRRVLREVAAHLQDRDPVAHLDRLVDVVGDEDDRLADLGLQAQELVLEALAVDRVDRAERLVHQHQRRVGGERAGDADALALAAGELRGIARAPCPAAARSGPAARSTRAVDAALVPAEQPRDGGDVVADRAVREQADLLDHVADLAPQVVDVAVSHAAPADEDVAAR